MLFVKFSSFAVCLLCSSLSDHFFFEKLQCDCSAPAGWFVLCRLRILGWRGGVEEVSVEETPRIKVWESLT